jgi:hypothetical protein
MQVLEHDIDEEELRDMLLEAMQNMLDAPVEDEAGSKGTKASDSVAGGFFARRFKRKATSAKLSSEELDAAAHWLIERFGQEADEESDEESEHEDVHTDAAAEAEEEVCTFFLFLCLTLLCFFLERCYTMMNLRLVLLCSLLPLSCYHKYTISMVVISLLFNCMSGYHRLSYHMTVTCGVWLLAGRALQ